MINCVCLVQEGQSADLNKGEIQEKLNTFTATSFKQAANVIWVPVAAGHGYTAGEPSTSSVVSISADVALNPQRREALLRELVTLWTTSTECIVDEIVAVISDPVQH